MDRAFSLLSDSLQELKEWGQIIATALGALLFAAFVWKEMRIRRNRLEKPFCRSGNCVRCQQYKKSSINSLVSTLSDRCYRHILTHIDHDSAPIDIKEYAASRYPRVVSTITSIQRKSAILLSVYRESGVQTVVQCEEVITHHPHIWTVPNLTRSMFWRPSSSPQLDAISIRLESPLMFAKMFEDYKRAEGQSEAWITNSTPRGQWKMFPLYNQGHRVDENCLCCNDTVQTIKSFPTFMAAYGCIFGNAMFSVLEPNSSIEPHTGPCNFRLRCHFPLIIPGGFKVQVGTDIKQWKEGKLLVFDDSFVHCVWHENVTGGDLTSEEEKGNEARVVFIFDVWHPDLDEKEIDILSHCYSEPIS